MVMKERLRRMRETQEGDLDGDEGEAELEEVELARPPKKNRGKDA